MDEHCGEDIGGCEVDEHCGEDIGGCEVETQASTFQSQGCDQADVFIGQVETDKKRLGIRFQVADVIKPLISVKRLTEKGNRVCFGPNEEDNYIENKESKSRVELKQTKKGSYLLKAKFSDEEETEIVVDSGAEENVCPKKWGEAFGFEKEFRPLNLRSASGGKIPHYGEREVIVESPF